MTETKTNTAKENNADNQNYEVADEKEVKAISKKLLEQNLEAYKKLLVQRGNEKLREQLPNITITSQLETSEFFEHWNIGDKVTCKSNKYGIQYDVRITGLKYTIDKNNYTVEVLFGAPLIIKKEGD